MPFKLSLTLRQKIFVCCLIVLSPVILLAYLLVHENSSYVKQGRLDSISTRATLVQLAIDESIDSTTRFLSNLAQTPAAREKDWANLTRLFSDIFPLYSDFTTLGAADEEGRVIVSAQRGGTFSLTVADRPYYQKVMETGQPVVSGRVIGRATDQPVFVIAVPVRDDSGRISGAVGAGISLKQIQQRLEQLGKEAGDVIIVDSDGEVLSHPNWNYVLEETNLRALSPVELALKGKRGTAEYVDPLEGGNWLWAYQPLSRAPWAVAVRYPATTVYFPVYATLLKWLLYLFGAVALALILASFSAERASRSLRRLARRMATAAPAGSVEEFPQANLDELHQLTHVFSRICSTLNQTSEELADLKGELANQAKKLEVLTQKAIEAREEERRRIAMNIHDGVLQLITAAQGGARLARTTASSRPDVVARRLGQVELVLEQAMVELRGMARGVHPPALEEVGLVQAVYYHLTILREVFDVPRFSLRVSGDARELDPEVEMAAFRIAQESLSNVGKHAGANSAEVFIDFTHTCLRLVVVDDGKGFDVREIPDIPDSHCGLANMRERAAWVGGRCTILSMPGEGTRVEVEIPSIDSAFDPSALVIRAKGQANE